MIVILASNLTSRRVESCGCTVGGVGVAQNLKACQAKYF